MKLKKLIKQGNARIEKQRQQESENAYHLQQMQQQLRVPKEPQKQRPFCNLLSSKPSSLLFLSTQNHTLSLLFSMNRKLESLLATTGGKLEWLDWSESVSARKVQTSKVSLYPRFQPAFILLPFSRPVTLTSWTRITLIIFCFFFFNSSMTKGLLTLRRTSFITAYFKLTFRYGCRINFLVSFREH